MRRALRRWFRCRKGAHRDVLDMVSVTTEDAPPTLAIHLLRWRCLDCRRDHFLGYADNIQEERKAGRIA